MIKDLETHYHKCQRENIDRVNVRVLGKLEKLVPKQKIIDYIEKNPQTSVRNFWIAMLTDDKKKYDLDEMYGIINYRNHIVFVDATLALMQYSLTESNIYFFLGELEEVISN